MSKLVDEVRDLFKRNHSLVISTVSPRGNPQSSLVVYVSDGDVLYAMTGEGTRKVKNIKKKPLVSVTIPFYKNLLHRLITRAPPASIMFKADSEIISYNEEEPRRLFKQHMGMEPPDTPNEDHVWLRLKPRSRVTCYGVGIPLWEMRKPEKAYKIVKL